jgi:Nif-specific regulatory protein
MNRVLDKNSEISFLYNISKELGNINDTNGSVSPILQNIADYLGISCCALMIIKNGTKSVILEEIYGLKQEEKKHLHVQLNEVAPKVIETGEPILLPKMSHEPQFIKSSRDLADFKYEISLVCVPIKASGKIMGLVAFSLEFYENISFKIEFRMLNIIGSMIAYAIQNIQEKAEEIAILRSQNQQLKHALNENQVNANIIGNSSSIKVVFDLIQKVSTLPY